MSSLVKTETKLNVKVFGYVRYNCKSFNVEMLYVDVINVIILYCYLAESLILKCVDKFDAEIIGGDEFVMLRNWRKWVTMWGTNKITNKDKKVFTWDFSFESWSKDTIIMVGISNQLTKDISYECFAAGESDMHHYFAVSNCGHKIYKEITRTEDWTESLDVKFGSNFVLTMVLDLTGHYGKLKYYINQQYKQKCNFNSIKLKDSVWSLCISVQLCGIKSVKLNWFNKK